MRKGSLTFTKQELAANFIDIVEPLKRIYVDKLLINKKVSC